MKSLFLLPLVLCTASLTNMAYAADPAKSATPAKADDSTAATAPSKFTLPDPVAVVEGTEIKAAEVEKALNMMIQRMGKPASGIPDDQKLRAAHMIVDQMIVQQLVKTRAAGVKVDDADVDARFKQISAQPNFEQQLKANDMTPDKLKDQIREMMRGRKWMESQVSGTAAVTDADAKAFFDSHASMFDEPEQVRASHILVMVPEDAKPDVVAEKQKAIDAAAARLAKGEDFAKVASDVSEDPGSKTQGGDLGFFAKGRMVPEFADAAFALKKDEVSKVVKTKFGFHIIKLTDRKDAHKDTFDEAKPKIMGYLTQMKQRDRTMQVLSDLKAKADVKNNLPPEPAASPAGAPQTIIAPQTDSKKSSK